MNKLRGFTLLELMIAVAIVGILAAVALPSYRSHVSTVNRSAAQQLLLSAVQKEQQYFLDAREFIKLVDSTGLNLAPTVPPNPAATTPPPVRTEQGWGCTTATSCDNANFTVEISVPNPQTTPPSFMVIARAISTGSNSADSADAGIADGANAALTIKQDGTKAGKWN